MSTWKRFFAGEEPLWIFPVMHLQKGDMVITKKTKRLILTKPTQIDERLAIVETLDIASNRIYKDKASHFGNMTQVIRDGVVIYDGDNPPKMP